MAACAGSLIWRPRASEGAATDACLVVLLLVALPWGICIPRKSRVCLGGFVPPLDIYMQYASSQPAPLPYMVHMLDGGSVLSV